MKKIIITESDKQYILSMYGIIKEDNGLLPGEGEPLFKSQKRADEFRTWVHDNYKQVALDFNLDPPPSPHFNSNEIRKVAQYVPKGERKSILYLWMDSEKKQDNDKDKLRTDFINPDKFYQKQDVLSSPDYNRLEMEQNLFHDSYKYQCVPYEQSIAIEYCGFEGIPKNFIKLGLGVLKRESNFGMLQGRYGAKVLPEYIMNRLFQNLPWIKPVLDFGAKKVFNKDNWVPSMGIGQMIPEIAKKYNINLEQQLTISGSLYATSRYLMDLNEITKKYFSTNKPSVIIDNGKLINNPSSTGNAALDAAIMSYNLGNKPFEKKYCKTDNQSFLAPCDSKNLEYQPYPKSNPNLKLKVNPNDIVNNYTPTLNTNTGFGYKITSTGYLKEVVDYSKTVSCL